MKTNHFNKFGISYTMDIQKGIGKLPPPKRGFVLPYHKYTGPYNPLPEQLDEDDQPVAGDQPCSVCNIYES